MTTGTVVRRTTDAVVVEQSTEPQVTPVLPLSVGLAVGAGITGLLALWSELYAGRTGQAQLLGGVVALVLLAAFYTRVREQQR